MTSTALLAGILREVHRNILILAAGTRITFPPDLSAEGIAIGASLCVTVTRSDRGEWIARQIEHEPRRNLWGTR